MTIVYTATALVSVQTTTTVELNTVLQGTAELLTGVAIPTPLYDLIDGGEPGEVYAGILGFNLITGGQP